FLAPHGNIHPESALVFEAVTNRLRTIKVHTEIRDFGRLAVDLHVFDLRGLPQIAFTVKLVGHYNTPVNGKRGNGRCHYRVLEAKTGPFLSPGFRRGAKS